MDSSGISVLIESKKLSEQKNTKFELENVRESKAKHLSGGQRRKLGVALALLKKPKIQAI